jgi:hypothetical protein
MTEDRGQKRGKSELTENRKQKTDDRRWKTQVSKQKREKRKQSLPAVSLTELAINQDLVFNVLC